MAAARGAGDTPSFERPLELFADLESPTLGYAAARDGRFLLVEEVEPRAASRSQLTLVLKWIEELKRLAPLRWLCIDCPSHTVKV